MDSQGTFRRCFYFIIITHNDAHELFKDIYIYIYLFIYLLRHGFLLRDSSRRNSGR